MNLVKASLIPKENTEFTGYKINFLGNFDLTPQCTDY